MKTYYTYIARCADNSLYTGYCINLKEREQKHNSGTGAKYTRSRRPIKIIYFEKFSSRNMAMKREIEIKKWQKNKKEKLILST